MNRNICLFVYFLISLSILYVAGAPVIESVTPSWGVMSANLDIVGTGFGSTIALNSVLGNITNTCTIQTATTTKIKCSFKQTLDFGSLSLTVTTGGQTSAPITYGVISVTKNFQDNSLYSLAGQFYSIPDPSKIFIRTLDQTMTIPVTYNPFGLTWDLSMGFVKNGANFELVDGSTNSVVRTYSNVQYGPIVKDIKFYESSIVFTGYVFDPSITVTSTQTAGVVDTCTVTSVSETSLTCTTVASYFVDYFYFPSDLKQNSKLTSVALSISIINSFKNTGVDSSTLSCGKSLTQTTGIRILGLSSTPIIPTSVTVSSQTEVVFTYPPNAQCGFALVSTDASLNYQRLTSSTLVCPTPLLQNVLTKPDISNNYYLTFSGKFLNNKQYKIGTEVLTYSIQYGSGGVKSCPVVSSSPDANYVYTVICQIPNITKPPSFKLIASTTKGQSSTMFVGFQPSITTITQTDYKVPGVVTITGSAFSSFDLLVTIGGSQCLNPVVPEDGTQITCTFNSDVTVVDFSKPLEVVVSISSTYIDKKSIFYYNRPDPIISTSTSTNYGVPGTVTITGTYLYSTNLVVTIGGSPCTSPLSAPDGNSITCQFSSSVTVTDISAPLEISVTINSVVTKNSVFYYTLQNPTITSSTQTIFGKPGIITITGSAFYNFDLVVEIGNSPCKSAAASKDSKHITCFFESDVQVVDISTPLEVFVSIDTNFVAKENVFYYAEPTQVLISNSTSTVYGVAGIVTLTGTNFFGQDLVVTIGNSPCSSPVASQDKTQLTCNFNSDVKVLDIQSPLDVFVSVEPDNNITSSIFYYTLPTPTIVSSTSTLMGTPAMITITGTSFYNFDLIVTIGGSSQCTSPVASQDNKQITCKFEADIQISDYNTPLDVSVIIATNYKANKAVFYYIKPIQVSIFSSTSTKYGVPGIITIIGNNFINDQLFVQIGGSQCTDAVASQDSKQLTCNFKSDIQVSNFNTALDVFVSIKSLFNATEPVFLYIKSDKNCPVGSNGQMCSGHGTCNQQLNCDCSKEWESSDCSLPNTGGTVIPDPNVNPNDTSSTIVTPGGSWFDVGIVLIKEIDKDNNVVQSYNITSISWNNITKQDNQHLYTTTLLNTNDNSNTTLNVNLSINNLDERVYYNFAGDIIPILPKSIKYQVELHNYTFSSSLNTMQFIFKSGIIKEGGECVYESNTSTQSSSDSIRSIQMMLNGETLVGTFSDRIVMDDRPSYNQVNRLTNDQITNYNLDTQSVYIAIITTSFKNEVVVDPNFGVLITADPDQENKCKKKFAAWKIAMISVFGVAGVGLAVTTVMLVKKRKVANEFNAKLKSLNNQKID